MAWTKEQCERIFDETCKEERSECPTDGSVLKTRVSRHSGGFDVFASCPRCGVRMSMKKAEDPLAGRFRPWTGAEKNSLLDDYYKQYPVTCPVDGTPIKPIDTSSLSSSGVMLVCFRCDNQHQHSV